MAGPPAAPAAPATPAAPELARSVSLLQLSLYGIGTTVGAGIYVLVGAAAATAGANVALGFLLAAVIVAPSAASFAALARRLPFSAGEAAYVDAAFGRPALSLAVGLCVALAGTVSAAAITRGSIGYVAAIAPAPEWAILLAIILGLGAVAAWGIGQSMRLAATLTVIELTGLLIVVAAGVPSLDGPALAAALVPDLGNGPWLMAFGISQAALLAFFAFIGFEDIVNVAEETRSPTRTVPLAIVITLAATALLYMAVAIAAVTVVPPAELAASDAPLALVVERAFGGGRTTFAAIAVLATLNGILVQIIMASRVLYGLARLGRLPAIIGRVSTATKTPLVATAIVLTAICTAAFAVPLVRLAETTSALTLVIFATVNAALFTIRRHEMRGLRRAWRQLAVPAAGIATCLAFLALYVTRLASG